MLTLEEVIELYPKIQIVFVTAYSQYAIEAFELNAIDYCLKQVSKVRLERTIDKIKERMPQDPQTKVFIRCFGGFDIYVNGKLLNFNLSKAKELLAYLVNNKFSSDYLGLSTDATVRLFARSGRYDSYAYAGAFCCGNDPITNSNYNHAVRLVCVSQ